MEIPIKHGMIWGDFTHHFRKQPYTYKATKWHETIRPSFCDFSFLHLQEAWEWGDEGMDLATGTFLDKKLGSSQICLETNSFWGSFFVW